MRTFGRIQQATMVNLNPDDDSFARDAAWLAYVQDKVSYMPIVGEFVGGEWALDSLLGTVMPQKLHANRR